jgi:hypothetical protein
MPPLIPRAAALLTAAALSAALTACTGGAAGPAAGQAAANPPAAAGGAAGAGGYQAKATEIGRRFAACARSHGGAGFPDPRLRDDGELDFPGAGKDALDAAAGACGQILEELPPNPLRRPLPPEDLERLRQFAACMRRNGVSDHPDPDEYGDFDYPDSLMTDGRPGERLRTARQRCRAEGIDYSLPPR